MNRTERVAKIRRLCAAAGCSDKIKKIHFEQFVDRQWHPHPPQAWEKWIRTQPEFQEIVLSRSEERAASVKLFNCASFYERFCESKQFGIV